MSGSPPHGTLPDARFSLDFLFGRGFIAVDHVSATPWLAIRDVRVELPGLRFPFDIAGGVHRFRHLRGPVHRARIAVDPAGLAEALRRAPLGDEAFDDLHVEAVDDGFAWSVVVRGLGSSGALTGRMTPLVEHATSVRLVIHDVLAIGRHAAPAAWLAAELARRVIASTVFIPRQTAPTIDDGDVLVDVNRVTLGPLFLERGYRMPGGERSTMQLDRSDAGWQLTLRTDADDAPLTPADPAMARRLGERDAYRAARAHLLAGRVDDALDALDDAPPVGGAATEAALMRLDALIARDDARSLAQATELLASDPATVPPLPRHALTARLAEARGDTDAARGALQQLAEAADVGGQRLVAAAARAALAELLVASAPAAAREVIDEALASVPGSLRALRLRARIDRERRDRAGLTDALRRLAPREPDPEARLSAWRELAALARDPREALRALERARALAPDDPRLLDDLVQASLSAGRPLDAARASARAAAAWRSRDPERAARAHHVAGRLWAEVLGDPASGVVETRRALALVPGDAARLADLVTWALAADDLHTAADAIAEARLAAERADASGSTDATRGLRARVLAAAARIATRRGDADTAIEAAREALALAPDDGDALDTLVESCVGAGRAADALPVLRRIASSASGPALRNRARRRLADLLLALDPRALDAEQALEDALEDDPDDRDALDRLVRLLREREEVPRAITVIERVAEAARTAASRAFAWRLAVDAWDLAGRPDRARSALRSALTEEPGDPGLLRLAVRRFAEDERARAIEALAIHLDDAEAAMMLGDLADDAETAGQHDEAARLYRLALRREDRDAWRDALDRLGSVEPVRDDGIGLERARPFQQTRREVQRVGARNAGPRDTSPTPPDAPLAGLDPGEAAREHARLRAEGLRALYEADDADTAARALSAARELAGGAEDAELDDALEAALEATDDADGVAALYRDRLAATRDPERRRELTLLLATTLTDRVGAPEAAIEVLAPLLAASSADSEALRARAEARAAAGAADDAIADLHTVLALDGLDPWERQDTLRRVADLAGDIGDDAAAARAWRELLDEIPGDNEALRGLKRACIRAGDQTGLLAVLGRELALLTGRIEPFETVPRDAVDRFDHVALPLRAAFAEALVEASAVAASVGSPADAVDALAAMVGRLVDDPEPLDAVAGGLRSLRAAGIAGTDEPLADALDALATHLLDPEAADALRDEAATVRDGHADPDDGPTAPVARPRRAAPTLPDAVRDRLDALDARAVDDPDEALAALDAWFRSVRLPAARRELLVRRGRWLLRTGAGQRAAGLALKGALILDPAAPDTRLGLCEVMMDDDPRAAAEQLGACLDSLATGGWPDDEAFAERVAVATSRLRAAGALTPAWHEARADAVDALLDTL